jgi:hypothetical protein
MAIPVPADLRPRGSVVSAPPRRPGSVRRTVTMDFTWSDGLAGDTVLDGRARDLRTSGDGVSVVLAGASLGLVSDARRVIKEIRSAPGLPGLRGLAGESAMAGFRRRLAGVTAASGAGAGTMAATLLYQLLDDVPGATLVSGAAWQRWYDMEEYLQLKADVRQRIMTDVCTGYSRGSSALNPDGTLRWRQGRQPAVDIDAAGDGLAWHRHADPAGVTMRRARRIDVWLAGPVILIDAFFQDSSTLPEGGRQSIHEYTLTAEADLGTGTLRAVNPVPRVLPYDECPLAVRNVAALAGLPLGELRGAVLERLRGPLGCTHLNDMLRALAAVPALAAQLRLPTDPRSAFRSGPPSRVAGWQIRHTGQIHQHHYLVRPLTGPGLVSMLIHGSPTIWYPGNCSKERPADGHVQRVPRLR